MIILEEKLKEHFGFEDFKKGQKEVIEKVVNGRSAAAIFPTGAGKSLCYQLPAMLLPNLTIVVSPLLSLMYDQQSFLESRDIPSAVLDSTLSREEYHRVLREAVNGDLKILMISVERFRNERFRGYLANMKISLLVVDEAHCISEWGHNFRPEYLKIPGYIKEYCIDNLLLLTATATKAVIDDMAKKLNIDKKDIVKTGFYRSNLNINVRDAEYSKKINYLKNTLKDCSLESTIVYVTLQKTADNLASELISSGIIASSYHAGLGSEKRVDIQRDFMSGKIPVIVATIAFGMGIDKSNIRRIIHYDLPKSLENYSQEIGRAGRDGLNSYCEVLGDTKGITLLENFIYGDTPTLKDIDKVLNSLMDSEGFWEIRIKSLSSDSNIRQLPLKTLLVYLEIKGVIESSHTYFSNYQFKTSYSGKEILSKLESNKRSFAANVLRFTTKKRTWITMNIEEFTMTTGIDRREAISLLEELDGLELLELSAKDSVDVYRVKSKNFNIKNLSKELYSLFKQKEKSEVNRISNMLTFFRSEKCLSRELAGYFNYNMEGDCGHCSVCSGNRAILKIDKQELPDIKPKVQGYLTKIDDYSPELIAKFLCGISTPLFTNLKAKNIKGWGSLEEYPYLDVLKRVSELISQI